MRKKPPTSGTQKKSVRTRIGSYPKEKDEFDLWFEEHRRKMDAWAERIQNEMSPIELVGRCMFFNDEMHKHGYWMLADDTGAMSWLPQIPYAICRGGPPAERMIISSQWSALILSHLEFGMPTIEHFLEMIRYWIDKPSSVGDLTKME